MPVLQSHLSLDSARRFLLASFFIVAILLLGRAGAASASAPRGATCGWSLYTTPNREVYNELNADVALAPDNIWAVGSSGNGNIGQLTLIEHWNGTAWSIVPSPNPGSDESTLLGITALSPQDMWAVGLYNGATGGSSFSLVLH